MLDDLCLRSDAWVWDHPICIATFVDVAARKAPELVLHMLRKAGRDKVVECFSSYAMDAFVAEHEAEVEGEMIRRTKQRLDNAALVESIDNALRHRRWDLIKCALKQHVGAQKTKVVLTVMVRKLFPGVEDRKSMKAALRGVMSTTRESVGHSMLRNCDNKAFLAALLEAKEAFQDDDMRLIWAKAKDCPWWFDVVYESYADTEEMADVLKWIGECGSGRMACHLLSRDDSANMCIPPSRVISLLPSMQQAPDVLAKFNAEQLHDLFDTCVRSGNLELAIKVLDALPSILDDTRMDAVLGAVKTAAAASMASRIAQFLDKDKPVNVSGHAFCAAFAMEGDLWRRVQLRDGEPFPIRAMSAVLDTPLPLKSEEAFERMRVLMPHFEEYDVMFRAINSFGIREDVDAVRALIDMGANMSRAGATRFITSSSEAVITLLQEGSLKLKRVLLPLPPFKLFKW